MNNIETFLIWFKVIFIRLPKEIWYQIEQLYYDEKLRSKQGKIVRYRKKSEVELKQLNELRSNINQRFNGISNSTKSINNLSYRVNHSRQNRVYGQVDTHPYIP